MNLDGSGKVTSYFNPLDEHRASAVTQVAPPETHPDTQIQSEWLKPP
jgi:hypothetical protein